MKPKAAEPNQLQWRQHQMQFKSNLFHVELNHIGGLRFLPTGIPRPLSRNIFLSLCQTHWTAARSFLRASTTRLQQHRLSLLYEGLALTSLISCLRQYLSCSFLAASALSCNTSLRRNCINMWTLTRRSSLIFFFFFTEGFAMFVTYIMSHPSRYFFLALVATAPAFSSQPH